MYIVPTKDVGVGGDGGVMLSYSTTTNYSVVLLIQALLIQKSC